MTTFKRKLECKKHILKKSLIFFSNIWENAILRLPLVFLENISETPYGLQEWYLRCETEKNSKLKELYKEFGIFINSNKQMIDYGEKNFLVQRFKTVLTE